LTKRAEIINRTLSAAVETTPLLSKLASPVVEPLLQHYGIRTSWIDLVDNIWVALWFACHNAYGIGKLGEYVHFERRRSRKEEPAQRFAYIILVATDFADVDLTIPGYWRGRTTELVDLRVAAPSIFVRPHAQHGLLFRNRGDSEKRVPDYSSSLVGVIRVALDDAIEWLGDGSLFNVHSLFPPPAYDGGYRILLKDWPVLEPKISRVVGTIAHVGA